MFSLINISMGTPILGNLSLGNLTQKDFILGNSILGNFILCEILPWVIFPNLHSLTLGKDADLFYPRVILPWVILHWVICSNEVQTLV